MQVSQSIGGSEFQNLPLFTLTFDDTPPARAVIDPVAADNIVTGPEKNAGVTVSGSAEANGSVLVTWAGASTVVRGRRQRQVERVLQRRGDPTRWRIRHHCRRSRHRRQHRRRRQATVIVSTSAFPTAIGVISGDDRVNASEAASVQVGGISEAGSNVSVDWQGVLKPALADGERQLVGCVQRGGSAESRKSRRRHFAVTASAVNPIGNVSNASRSVLVDRVAPPSPNLERDRGQQSSRIRRKTGRRQDQRHRGRRTAEDQRELERRSADH